MFLNFHKLGPLVNSIFKKTALWSGAIDVRISTFLTQLERGREIKKKSILDFKFKGFDSYVND